MIALLLRVVGLTAVYLLVLTSVQLGDVVIGLALSMLLVAAGQRIRPLGSAVQVPLWRRLVGVPALVGGALVDVVLSSWQTAAFVLGRNAGASGLVEVPIPPCGPTSAAAWGVRVGISPDTVVVGLDETRGRMLLHVIDARDPDAVIAAQLDAYERRQRRVFP
jgi:multisubunit Na+/H+ antiporter MnhE subunit